MHMGTSAPAHALLPACLSMTGAIADSMPMASASRPACMFCTNHVNTAVLCNTCTTSHTYMMFPICQRCLLVACEPNKRSNNVDAASSCLKLCESTTPILSPTTSHRTLLLDSMTVDVEAPACFSHVAVKTMESKLCQVHNDDGIL